MKKSTADTLRRLFWEWLPWIFMGPGFIMGAVNTVKIHRGQDASVILVFIFFLFVIFFLGTALGLTRAGGSISLMSNIKENEDITVESYCENRVSSSSYSQLMLARRQNGDVKYFYAMLSDFDGIPPKVGWTYRKVGAKMVDIKKI